MADVQSERQQLRHAETWPIWDLIREYLASDTVSTVTPKEHYGQALAYLRNHFGRVLIYLEHGIMPIDNTYTKHLMKQVALGRKN